MYMYNLCFTVNTITFSVKLLKSHEVLTIFSSKKLSGEKKRDNINTRHWGNTKINNKITDTMSYTALSYIFQRLQISK